MANINTFGLQPTADPAITGNSVIDSKDLAELALSFELQYGANAAAYRQRYDALLNASRIAKTQSKLNSYEQTKQRRIFRRSQIHSESAPYDSAVSGDQGDFHTGEPTIKESNQNVHDHMGETPDIATLGPSLHNTMDGGTTQWSLDQFFRRPISIWDDKFTGDYGIQLDVWDLWSRDPTIRAKLSNYAYFKGNLCIRVALSGTPYHYGRLLASYQPYPTFNEPLVATQLVAEDRIANGTAAQQRGARQFFNAYLSQAPGTKTIDPKDNMPLEMCLPFISYKQKFRLTALDGLVITNNTPFPDFEEAGRLYLRTLNAIRVANADFEGPVSINVFAWVEGIELGCITATNIDITAESSVLQKGAGYAAQAADQGIMSAASSMVSDYAAGKSSLTQVGQDLGTDLSNLASQAKAEITKTEHEDPGPVTKAATAITNISAAAAAIPVFRPIATTVSAVSAGLGAVASYFGWSRPNILDKAVYVKNMPFQNGAVTSVHDTAYTLAIDPKNELSIDPSMGGMDYDELCIGAISSRKSYIGTFVWTDEDLSMSQVLWNSTVSPNLGVCLGSIPSLEDPTFDQNVFQDSALAFSSRPFTFWRGSINFTFEVVCSRFHRGKLLIRYEPNIQQYNTIIKNNQAPLNQQNSVILDIQNGQTVTIKCDWAATRSWCNMPPPSQDFPLYTGILADENPYSNNQSWIFSGASSQNFFVPDNQGSSDNNGVLEVRVLNELVQPTPDATVTINVYAWSDDMEYARPSAEGIDFNRTLLPAQFNQFDLTETMLFFKQALLGGVAVPVSGFDDIDINEIGISVQPSDILGATFTAQGFLYVVEYWQTPISETAICGANIVPPLAVTPESAVVVSEEPIVINPGNSSHKDIHIDHMGEKIVSFRNLLKRYQTTSNPGDALTVSAGDVAVFGVLDGSCIPQTTSGYYANTNTGGVQPNLSSAEINENLFSYLRYAFLGMRGSMKHRIKILGDLTSNPTDYITVTLRDSKDGFTTGTARARRLSPIYREETLDLTDFTLGSALGLTRDFKSGLEGTINYHLLSNGGVEFVTPYYSSNLWQPAFNSGTNNPETEQRNQTINSQMLSGNVSRFTYCFTGELADRPTGQDTATATLFHDTAIGEDFQFLRFQGAPSFRSQLFAQLPSPPPPP